MNGGGRYATIPNQLVTTIKMILKQFPAIAGNMYATAAGESFEFKRIVRVCVQIFALCAGGNGE